MFFRARSGQPIFATLASVVDGSAITTGATVAVIGDGGAQAAGTGTLAHKGGGQWSYVFAQAETDFEVIGYTFAGTNVIPQGASVVTMSPYDGLIAASATAGASTVQLGSGESSVDGVLNGVDMLLQQGSAKQFVTITGYVGSTKVATFTPVLAFNLTGGSATYSLGTPSGAGGGGVVTGYATGQDPATLVLATPSDKLATDGSGRVTLAPAGLDAIPVETGINARQALSPILAAAGGKSSGLDPNNLTSPVIYCAAGPTGTATERLRVVVDANGNRTSTVLTIPT